MPSGEKLLSTAENHPEILWAARGGVARLFFIVTRFHLRCYPAKSFISCHTRIFHLSELFTLLAHISNPSRSTPSHLQIMISLISAPDDLLHHCHADDNNRLIALSTIAFTQDEQESKLIQSGFVDSSSPLKPLATIVETEIDFERIYEKTDNSCVWKRWRSDNTFTNRPLEASNTILTHLVLSPSMESQIMIIWRPEQTYPDAAYSATGMFFISTYAQWQHARDDEKNFQWLSNMHKELNLISSGHYINEFDR